jgi:hypothetical protein
MPLPAMKPRIRPSNFWRAAAMSPPGPSPSRPTSSKTSLKSVEEVAEVELRRGDLRIAQQVEQQAGAPGRSRERRRVVQQAGRAIVQHREQAVLEFVCHVGLRCVDSGESALRSRTLRRLTHGVKAISAPTVRHPRAP